MSPNSRTALSVLSIAFGMFALAYAGFPLYNLFCKVTGYGGTPKISAAAPEKTGTRMMKVRFNSDIAPELAWDFKPVQKSVSVKTGENSMAFFTAKNISNKPLTGVATFNVTPLEAGQYFNKIQCFCFNNQTLKPGEKVQMPVSFYIDPAIETNMDLKGIDTITLSYTFFKAEN